MSLDDIMLDDLDAIIPQIGESITYTPKGGSETEIVAVIERNGESRISESQMGASFKFVILVSRSDIPTVICDGDTVAFPGRIGGDPETFTVVNILSQDASHWKLAVS